MAKLYRLIWYVMLACLLTSAGFIAYQLWFKPPRTLEVERIENAAGILALLSVVLAILYRKVNNRYIWVTTLYCILLLVA